jgi:hypothetical protein
MRTPRSSSSVASGGRAACPHHGPARVEDDGLDAIVNAPPSVQIIRLTQWRLGVPRSGPSLAVTMMGTTLPTPLCSLYEHRVGFGSLMVTVVYATYAVGVITALLLFGQWLDQVDRRPLCRRRSFSLRRAPSCSWSPTGSPCCSQGELRIVAGVTGNTIAQPAPGREP